MDKTKPFGKHCQVSWLAGADQGAHDPSEVEGHGRRKVTLVDFLQFTKPRPTSSARITKMRESTLHPLAT